MQRIGIISSRGKIGQDILFYQYKYRSIVLSREKPDLSIVAAKQHYITGMRSEPISPSVQSIPIHNCALQSLITKQIKLVSRCLGLYATLSCFCSSILNILVRDDTTCKLPLCFFQTSTSGSVDMMHLNHTFYKKQAHKNMRLKSNN